MEHETPYLQPVSTGARKHLVYAEHVERVGTHAHVEVILPGVLSHVLVSRYSSSLQGLRRQLLLLVGHLKYKFGAQNEKRDLIGETPSYRVNFGQTTGY